MKNDKLISKVSDALNESKFWFKLEEKVGDIDLYFLDELIINVEEFIRDELEANIDKINKQ